MVFVILSQGALTGVTFVTIERRRYAILGVERAPRARTEWKAHIANSIGGLVVFMLLVLVVYLFLTGRSVLRWTCWIALAWAG